MNLGLRSPIGAVVSVMCALVFWNDSANAQVRMYNVQWTNTAPTIDAMVGPGEWAAAAPAQGDWSELRFPETDKDTANNRIQMVWDASGLYILHRSDQTTWTPPDPDPLINFSRDNTFQYYLDPNADNEPNFATNPDSVIDGYQVAWAQVLGTFISTNANRQGVQFFTEAHIDATFGDQANWNRGVASNTGPALQGVVVAQTNGASGSLTEFFIPWTNFNADVSVPIGDYNRNTVTDAADFVRWRDTLGQMVVNPGDGADGDANGTVEQADHDLWRAAFGTAGEVGTAGLYHPFAPDNNDKWFFQAGQIYYTDPNNVLPVFNWTSSSFFADHPHAEITFIGRPPAAAGAVPEPASAVLLALAAIALASLSHRK